MTGPQVGSKEFRDEVVRIAELTVTTIVLEGYTFQNCRIIGPAVLVPQGQTTIVHCDWNAPGVDAVYWPIGAGRSVVVGAVAVVNCTFSSCQFENIGLAGDDSLREALLRGLGS